MKQAPIIITGAGQRLGLATALSLHKHGYKVLCTYRNHKAGVDVLVQQGIECIQADFSDDDGVADFIDYVVKRYTVVRGIIHNASEWLKDDNPPAELMQRLLQVHVKAPFQINQALKSKLIAYGEDGMMADIIHVTDHSASTGSESHIAYAASKAALENMMLSYAKALSPKVKVNSVAPSLLMFNDNDSLAYRQQAGRKSLLPVSPGVQEGVEGIAYLLNSEYITGHVLSLNGGRHLATATINSIMPVHDTQ